MLVVAYASDGLAQTRRRTGPARSAAAGSSNGIDRTGSTSARPREIGGTAMVVDELLSVLRLRPSLFADPVQRMRRGRLVKILGVAEADGVRFYKIAAPPNNFGWVQADSLITRGRDGEDERLARLIRVSKGFDQLELASNFLELFPKSPLRPAMLLLFGDLMEEAAAKLSKDASSRLDRHEMAATGAPAHSYYLNFNMLDRYRKLGAIFLFNPNTKQFHYDGSSWKELAARTPAGPESAEAQKRLVSLGDKMRRGTATAASAQ